MVLSMADCRVGTLVWVQRKNGSWWPGRLVEPTELRPFHLLKRRPGTPVKLLGKEDASVEWYNIEKSKRIKAFRCGEFNDCIKGVESNQAKFPKKIVKNARREDAIRHALQVEEEEVQKKRKAAGERREGIVRQAKRSQRVYLPAATNRYWNSPLQCDSAETGTSFRSMKSALSEDDSYVPDTVQRGTKLSDAAAHVATQPSLFGKYNEDPRNAKQKPNYELDEFSKFHPGNVAAAKYCIEEQKIKRKQNTSNLPDSLEAIINEKSYVERRNGILTSGKPWASNAFDTRPEEDSAYNGFRNRMETTLAEVEVTVQASHHGNHVPLVSLMSGLYGKAVIGYPINVEASDSKLYKHEIGKMTFDNSNSMMLKPSWKTSRRTTVCYVSQPHHQIAHPLSLEARENVSPATQEFMGKFVKKPSLSDSNQKTRRLPSSHTNKQHGGDECDPQPVIVSCVPVVKIFSKLLFAVGGV